MTHTSNLSFLHHEYTLSDWLLLTDLNSVINQQPYGGLDVMRWGWPQFSVSILHTLMKHCSMYPDPSETYGNTHTWVSAPGTKEAIKAQLKETGVLSKDVMMGGADCDQIAGYRYLTDSRLPPNCIIFATQGPAGRLINHVASYLKFQEEPHA